MSGGVPQWELAYAALIVGLGAVLFITLRRVEYGLPSALLISGLVLFQPALCNPSTVLEAGLFAVVVYAVAASAVSLVQQQDVRRIALLGGSLAGAQFIHPLWATTAAIMLPLALRNRLAVGNIAGVTGLYISILFIPALTAAAIFFLDASFRAHVFSIGRMLPAARLTLPHNPKAIAAVFISATPALVAFAVQPLSSSAQVVGVMAFALILACMALQFLALQFVTVSVGFGILAVPLFETWQKSKTRSGWALGLAIANAAAAWTAVGLVQVHG